MNTLDKLKKECEEKATVKADALVKWEKLYLRLWNMEARITLLEEKLQEKEAS